ncbi:uncharacterized protein MAM_07184 [Metarhizium album ARSEF 1941]|uniref:Uncharacterized protein n=1 Tax=Metarhizium album (strain ARSEF 1941) TaxID=1081103 RepID=A0A0B2WN93_METAS|nr:uncharacterized protein MAM_07184 [Metarhizium album ARSEF 1941]KHN94957.1 hypothetical protein MAM_07184 [Metarhizium album ARSEF 1941]
MAFLEDPRLRQRWNQITHDAEAATENAAAGIFAFQQNYINPCLASIADSIEQCTTVCLGDPDERLRRRRERQRARESAEFSFDFYDDWYEEEHPGGGLLGTWGGEDWDRLLAGTGSARRHGGDASDQPRRKRGMSYGTRGMRRKASQGDSTIIPSTQPIGFLSKLPWKMGGTLRYKPSAADLQDHPGKHDAGESAPLLGGDDESDYGEVLRMPRQRSGTTGSGETSDSYRSRGDLFPSDGEGEEDAVPLADDVTYDMVRRDGRSGGKTRSGKGKTPEGEFAASSRTVSRSTLGSTASSESREYERTAPPTPGVANPPTMDDLLVEEARLQKQEDDELARRKAAAAQLASERGLGVDGQVRGFGEARMPDVTMSEIYDLRDEAGPLQDQDGQESPPRTRGSRDQLMGSRGDDAHESSSRSTSAFHAARLPRFG